MNEAGPGHGQRLVGTRDPNPMLGYPATTNGHASERDTLYWLAWSDRISSFRVGAEVPSLSTNTRISAAGSGLRENTCHG